ncbi:50S ribosomal protein L9 [Caenispirillum bisanense]|uniref:Large ribosomal subunit protein bL9 n=1 Tax=Caenispirillum bisanense TaxID=414052 RepID=A0A286G1L2_9PROT|nr:50S ribosomal protein L9 [Caenispirillum bisanense]SOD89358.1 LSU ribosomal protein L9P [Caenispirillum bisanense]
MTEVILLERIAKLGQMGDTVKVKPGYARNFLLPQGKALRANEKNRKLFEAQRTQLEARNLERRQEAQAVAEKMADLSIIMVRQAGEGGQLYGSVTARDVAQAIKENGFSVERGQVELNTPIKDLGQYQVAVILHPEVTVSVPVTVARTQEEGEAQLRGAAEQPEEVAEEELTGFDMTPDSIEAEDEEEEEEQA